MSNRGKSVHLGLNQVDPGAYAGWDGKLEACENDARSMAAIAAAGGFRPTILLTEQATRSALTAALHAAAGELSAGDEFLLTFAGHGARTPAGQDLTEADGQDELTALYDGMLRDDDLGRLLAGFAPGVAVTVVNDSCHSATAFRDGPPVAGGVVGARVRAVPGDVVAELVATRPALRSLRAAPARGRAAGDGPDVLMFAACRDDEQALDGPVNGAFTGALLEVWADGSFDGDHHALRAAVAGRLRGLQHPSLLAGGPTARSVALTRPFTNGPVPSGTGQLVTKGNTVMTSTIEPVAPSTPAEPVAAEPFDNWADVSAALQSRGLVDGTTGTPVTVTPRAVRANGAAPRAASGITVRTFWWGFHIEIGHAELEQLLSTTNTVDGLISIIGDVVPSVRPYVTVAATFLAGAGTLLRALDEGEGIYLSMSWFAPGVFVPTTVPVGRETPVASRRVPVGEPHDFWIYESDRDVDTGLYIQNGQRVIISATGEIWSGVWFAGGNGPQGWPGHSANSSSPLPGAAPFQMLARLDGRYLPIGTGREFVYRGAGSKLFLRINDDVPGNGNGVFQVRVEVYED